jgi:hypothetical protein
MPSWSIDGTILPFFYFADLTASYLKSLRYEKFRSQGLIKTVQVMCPEKVQEFENKFQ